MFFYVLAFIHFKTTANISTVDTVFRIFRSLRAGSLFGGQRNVNYFLRERRRREFRRAKRAAGRANRARGEN